MTGMAAVIFIWFILTLVCVFMIADQMKPQNAAEWLIVLIISAIIAIVVVLAMIAYAGSLPSFQYVRTS